MKTLVGILCFLVLAEARAQTCPNRIYLKSAPPTSRNEKIIYKSAWNAAENREQTSAEGNHARKGAALLIHYKATQYVPPSSTLEIRDLNCKLIARMGRFPRCTSTGCGDYERWYLRAPRGSYLMVEQLAIAAGRSVLIRMKGRQWAVIQDVYNLRESK